MEKEVHIHGQQIVTLCGPELVPLMWLWECPWDFSDCSKRDQNGTFGLHSKPSADVCLGTLYFRCVVLAHRGQMRKKTVIVQIIMDLSVLA